MEQKKELLRVMFYRYCIVYTLVMGLNLAVACIGGEIEGAVSIKALLLIEVMAALCALGELFFWIGGELSKKKELFRYIFHYVYINLVVFVLVLQTMKVNLENILLVLVAVAVIYWINFITDFYKNKKDALKMNDLLEKINNNDD